MLSAFLTPHSPEVLAALCEIRRLLILACVLTKMHVRHERDFTDMTKSGLITRAEKLRLTNFVSTIASGPTGDGKTDNFPSRNRPTFAFHKISQQTSSLMRRGLFLSGDHHILVESEVRELAATFEQIEHLGLTILPLPYAQLTRLVALFFLLLLPLTVPPVLHWGSIPFLFFVNLIYFTADECAAQMETPFGNDTNDIDLEKMIRRIDKHTAAQLSLYSDQVIVNFNLFPEARTTDAQHESTTLHQMHGTRDLPTVKRSDSHSNIVLTAQGALTSRARQLQFDVGSIVPNIVASLDKSLGVGKEVRGVDNNFSPISLPQDDLEGSTFTKRRLSADAPFKRFNHSPSAEHIAETLNSPRWGSRSRSDRSGWGTALREVERAQSVQKHLEQQRAKDKETVTEWREPARISQTVIRFRRISTSNKAIMLMQKQVGSRSALVVEDSGRERGSRTVLAMQELLKRGKDCEVSCAKQSRKEVAGGGDHQDANGQVTEWNERRGENGEDFEATVVDATVVAGGEGARKEIREGGWDMPIPYPVQVDSDEENGNLFPTLCITPVTTARVSMPLPRGSPSQWTL